MAIRSVEFKRAHRSSLVVHRSVTRSRLHRALELFDGAPESTSSSLVLRADQSYGWKARSGGTLHATTGGLRCPFQTVHDVMASFLSGLLNIMCRAFLTWLMISRP